MIGPIKDGVRKDIKPWAIPEDSFEDLINAYQWRGRIVKRSGYKLLGTLANGTPVMGLRTKEDFSIQSQDLVAFDTTQAYFYSGTSFSVLPSIMPVTWSGTNYQFFFTTNYAGAFWATNSKPGLNGATITNAVAGAGFTTITTNPAHGFTTGQSVSIINITSTATDGSDDLNGNNYVITVTGATTFTIPFQTTNTYASGGFALNSYVTSAGQDGIRYYGGLTNGTGWANYNPPIDTRNALAGCLMIFPYRGYLVFLNTTEGTSPSTLFNYGNRARWTQIGTPYYSPPVPLSPNPQTIDPFAARDDLFGRGGANDAPTNEVIVSAAFIRDILVVYFERSTWRLRFVNNSQNPFVWERVNVELGSDCTFSAIPFDKGLMAIGNRGIIISDGNDTTRIDDKIPDQIFEVRQKNFGLYRVNGIRTFRTKLNYWTIPDSLNNADGTFPDYVLVYNYETGTWSRFDDCFTCFGYYYPSGSGQTWETLTDRWDSTSLAWNSGSAQIGYEQIVAGNQQGFVFIIDESITNGTNDPSLNISAITLATPSVFTSTNNNLPDDTWITIVGSSVTSSDDGVLLQGRNFQINKALTIDNTFTISEYKPIAVTITGVSITTFSYTIGYKGIISGFCQINIGSLVFTDPASNGILIEAANLGAGTINYNTGKIDLTFSPAISTSTLYIRIVSLDPAQGLSEVTCTHVYAGGLQIAKISNISITSKFFNFIPQDQKSRLSKIDFYTNLTTNGQFTCDVYADSSNLPANKPLPDNLFSNIVLTSPNPYQAQDGVQTIYRLFCDAIGSTLQLELYYSDQQMAVSSINSEHIELLALIFGVRKGGRIV